MGKKVLVVDDEPDARAFLKIFLESGGYQVTEAEDGYEAVEMAIAMHPDLILMDMAMPLVDGINSARTMRLHEELDNVPIVAMTAFGSFYERRARAAGCTDVVLKPLDFGRLKPVVDRYLGH